MQFVSFALGPRASRAQRELFRQSGHRVCLHLALQTNKPGWGNREYYLNREWGNREHYLNRECYQLRRTFAIATLAQQRDARPGRNAPAAGSAAGCALAERPQCPSSSAFLSCRCTLLRALRNAGRRSDAGSGGGGGELGGSAGELASLGSTGLCARRSAAHSLQRSRMSWCSHFFDWKHFLHLPQRSWCLQSDLPPAPATWHCLHLLRSRLCSQMLPPPSPAHSLHELLTRLCSQMAAPRQSTHVRRSRLWWQMLEPPAVCSQAGKQPLNVPPKSAGAHWRTRRTYWTCAPGATRECSELLLVSQLLQATTLNIQSCCLFLSCYLFRLKAATSVAERVHTRARVPKQGAERQQANLQKRRARVIHAVASPA
jgi:hypothetical protein